jgi:hypothetical protein
MISTLKVLKIHTWQPDGICSGSLEEPEGAKLSSKNLNLKKRCVWVERKKVMRIKQFADRWRTDKIYFSV